MGGKRKQRTQARDFREPRENVWKERKTTEGGEGGQGRGANFDEIVRDSATFQAYYKARASFRRTGPNQFLSYRTSAVPQAPRAPAGRAGFLNPAA